MQANAPEGIRAAPVLPVADDRVSEGGELSTDLAPPPGHERELEQRRPPKARQHPVAGDRLLAAARGSNAQGPVLHEVRGQRTLLFPDDAFHAGHVHPLGRARLELRLERPLHGKRLREDEEAGGLAIEPMDDEDPPASPRPHPIAQQAVDGPSALGGGRDRQERRGLVDHEEVLVLMYEAERRREGGRRRRSQFDTVAGTHQGVATVDDDAVDSNARAGEPLFEPAARHPRVEDAKPLPEHQVRVGGRNVQTARSPRLTYGHVRGQRSGQGTPSRIRQELVLDPR